MLVDGRLIFSKKQAGRFPEDGEVESRFEMVKAGKDLPPVEANNGGGAGALRRLVGRLLGT